MVDRDGILVITRSIIGGLSSWRRMVGSPFSSGGHFYRPETGGDSFSSILWEVSPGFQPDLQDYLGTLTIVDDANTFENEAADIRFNRGNYEVSVEDYSLDDFKHADMDDDD